MKRLTKILKISLISIVGLIGIILLGIFVYTNFFYEREMNQIENKLNRIENVTVINIWGHQDITLEEITARIKIDDKGEIVLSGLSSDVYNYPKRVSILEIGGYSFTWFSCNGGIGPGIDVGTESMLGNLVDIEFNSVEKVVDNYDNILRVVRNLEMHPDINHFETENSENYLIVGNKKSTDKDPIFYLTGVENEFEFAKTLKWNRKDCYYNRKK